MPQDMMHLVFLVHGTWGRGDSAWYHPTCAPTSFAAKLKVALGKRGVDPNTVIFVPFEWKGENTHSDRLEGAASLASKLIDLRRQYVDVEDVKVHFVAHSHGGNVVLKAIEIYLNDLAWADVPKMFDTRDIVTRDIVVASQRFLKDYADGKYLFRSPTDEIDKLLHELADTLEKISRRENNRLRFNITDDSFWDVERYSLRNLLGKAYSHVYTLPEHHRIGSVITFGTPFYEKHWRRTPAAVMTNWLLTVLFFFSTASVSMYISIVLASALASVTPWISWIGFDPHHWHWLLLVFWGICSLLVAISFTKNLKTELPLDTNVYFDEAVIPYYVEIVERVKLCRVLNIHATYLDEAYCLLSVYPFLSGTIINHIAQGSLPRLWDFKKPAGDVGLWRGSPPAAMRRRIIWRTRFATALARDIAYPLRLIVHKLKVLYIGHLVGTDLRVFGYGLPLDDSPGSSVITVENVLRKPYFETHTLDVSQQLADLILKGVEGKDRYDFLWNDDDLARRVDDSVLLKKLVGSPVSDYYRQLIVLEERAREFFGVVGLKHSMYYDNDVVINSVADFVTGQDPVVQCEGGAESQ